LTLHSLTNLQQKLPNTLDELDKELESQRARADLIAQSNPAVIRQYEEREQQIQELKNKLENENEMVESKKKEVETLKERWLSGLKDLVKRINDSFSKHFQRFGKGEVKLGLFISLDIQRSRNPFLFVLLVNIPSGKRRFFKVCTGDLCFLS